MSEDTKEIKEEMQDVAEAPLATKRKKKGGSGAPLLIGAVLLLGAGYFGYQYLQGDRATEGEVEVTEQPSGDSMATIALVNGEAITQGDLDAKIEQVRRSLPAGASDPTEDAAFELQLVDDLINLKLLTMTAMKRNYTVSDDEIAAEKAILIERFEGEENFNAQLELLGVSQEELAENMRNELLIRQLLEDDTDVESITVTDEEVAATYAMAVGDAEDAPELAQVADLIREELVNQKAGQMIEVYIQELRAEATIEKNL